MITVKELFDFVVKEKGVTLTPLQEVEFIKGCENAIADHNFVEDQKISARLYLMEILRHPQILI